MEKENKRAQAKASCSLQLLFIYIYVYIYENKNLLMHLKNTRKNHSIETAKTQSCNRYSASLTFSELPKNRRTVKSIVLVTPPELKCRKIEWGLKVGWFSDQLTNL